MTDRFALVPASYVYLLRDGTDGTEVLLQRRGPVPTWPGTGRPRPPGTSSPARRRTTPRSREALEELGITDLDLDFVLTMQRSQFGPAVEERVDWFFTARSWTGEPRIVEPEKAASLGWFALDDLPEPMVPHEAHALAHLFSGVGYLTFGWDAPPSGGGPSATAATGSTETQGGNR